MQLREALLFLS